MSSTKSNRPLSVFLFSFCGSNLLEAKKEGKADFTLCKCHSPLHPSMRAAILSRQQILKPARLYIVHYTNVMSLLNFGYHCISAILSGQQIVQIGISIKLNQQVCYTWRFETKKETLSKREWPKRWQKIYTSLGKFCQKERNNFALCNCHALSHTSLHLQSCLESKMSQVLFSDLPLGFSPKVEIGVCPRISNRCVWPKFLHTSFPIKSGNTNLLSLKLVFHNMQWSKLLRQKLKKALQLKALFSALP